MTLAKFAPELSLASSLRSNKTTSVTPFFANT